MSKVPGSCVQCGKCLEVCPLFKVTGREELTPRAKFFLESLDPSEGLDERDFRSVASLCLSCGRCENICPQKMSGPDLVTALRSRSGGFLRNCWNLWLSTPGLMWPMVAALSKFFPGKLPEPFGSARRKTQALFARSPEPWAELEPRVLFEERRAILFPGCVARYARRDWTLKAERFMDGLGLARAGEADFTCCGSSMGSAGLVRQQKAARKSNIKAWISSGRPMLVTICATCYKGLRDYEPQDFEAETDYEIWRSSLRPLSSLLEGGRAEMTPEAPERVIYHRPCHAPQNDVDQTFVQQLAGTRLAPVRKDLCCGFGGVMQLGAPELSKRVGAHCLSELLEAESGKPQILSGCSACVIQLAALTDNNIFAGHWLDILK